MYYEKLWRGSTRNRLKVWERGREDGSFPVEEGCETVRFHRSKSHLRRGRVDKVQTKTPSTSGLAATSSKGGQYLGPSLFNPPRVERGIFSSVLLLLLAFLSKFLYTKYNIVYNN